jgi:hypothetical protein
MLMPTDGKDYIWSEQLSMWLEVSNSGMALISTEEQAS